MLPVLLLAPPVFFIWCASLCALNNLETPGLAFTLLGLLNIWGLWRVLGPCLARLK